MHIAFLGFGLISGSIARALRASADPAWSRSRLVAWSPGGQGPARASVDGVIDHAAGTAREAVAGADLVILGAPPHLVPAQIEELAGPLRDVLGAGTVITDVASTKSLIVAAAERAGLRFVGGHPMAGREQSGYGAASADLFVDRPWVVVAPRGAAARDVALVEALAWACLARPLRLDAAEHDDATAAISHLPLVASAALVEAVAGTVDGERPGWDLAADLAAGGWASMTRLARGDAAMGAGIAATNGPAIADGLRAVRAALDDWIAILGDEPAAADLEARFRVARDRLGS
jgi:prephenate dehydrogenase